MNTQAINTLISKLETSERALHCESSAKAERCYLDAENIKKVWSTITPDQVQRFFVNADYVRFGLWLESKLFQAAKMEALNHAPK